MRLSDCLEAVRRVNGVDELRSETIRFAQRLGFDFVSVTVVVDRADGVDFHGVDNTPETYRPIFENDARSRRDPVMQHCKLNVEPIVWHQGTYVDAGLGELWEEQAPHGYRSGIALALHLPAGRHFIVGIDRDQTGPGNPEHCWQQAAELLLFACCAEGVATRLLVPGQGTDAALLPNLSLREKEVLQWTLEGKTAWEIGRILGISDQTVVRHLGHAAQKLGCVNKVQTVAMALRLGLIN